MAANYTDTEIVNAVAQIFRARITNTKTGGTLDTAKEYEQLLELASITFLLYPDSIFYIAQLVCNTLQTLVISEAALVEDMLVALEYMANPGTPVRDTTALSNAKTAILEFDPSSVFADRPEIQRFSRYVDLYATELAGNVVENGELVRCREEARNILRGDLDQLKSVHANMLSTLFALRDLLTTFVSLNIPSKVAVTSFSSIVSILDSMISSAKTASDADNVAASRQNMLLLQSSKSAVNTVSSFTNPGELKYRSPNNPIPPTMKHTGRVVGEGDPATILSGLGPWLLPVSAPLAIAVNGGPTQTVPVNTFNTSAIPGGVLEPFDISSDFHNIHVLVDPAQYKSVVKPGALEGTENTVFLEDAIPLKFKHLGAVVTISPPLSTTNKPPAPANDKDGDWYPRAIKGFPRLQSWSGSSWNSSTSELTLTGGTNVGPDNEDSVIGFFDAHIGCYVEHVASGTKFEILSISNPAAPQPNVIVIEARDLTPGSGAYRLYGQPIGTTETKFYVYPDYTQERGLDMEQIATIGPTTKTAKLVDALDQSVSNIIDGVTDEAIDIPTSVEIPVDSYTGYQLNWHVKIFPDRGNPKKLAIAPRSRVKPYAAIAYVHVAPVIRVVDPDLLPTDAVLLQKSAHNVLGLQAGRVMDKVYNTSDLLTAKDLVKMVGRYAQGVDAAVVENEILQGQDLSVLYGTRKVMSSTDWLAAGVTAGYVLEVVGGRAAGSYRIEGVTSTELTIRRTEVFDSGESELSYKIKSSQVRLSTAYTGVDSSIRVSGAPEFGFSTDLQYGRIYGFEAVDNKGNLVAFDRAAVGDLLRIAGDRAEYPITSVSKTLIEVSSGLASNLVGVGFEISGAAARSYSQAWQLLTTYTTSPNLLKIHHYDESLAELDAVLTSALIPGQNFASSRGRAQQYLADLLSILTDLRLRSSEYRTSVPTSSLPLRPVLVSYEAARVEAVDSILEAFLERKYDRAVDLLRSGNVSDFYSTNDETGSYAGNMMFQARAVNNDLPSSTSTKSDVEDSLHLATRSRTVKDSNVDFEETQQFDVED